MKQKTISIYADIPTVMDAACQAIYLCGWEIKEMDITSINASHGSSCFSWGETITVQVQESNGASYLTIQSKSISIDWGINNKNITQFLSAMSTLIPIAQIFS